MRSFIDLAIVYVALIEPGQSRFALPGWIFNSGRVYWRQLHLRTVTMSNDVKENLKSQSTWIRGLYILIFAVFYTIAEIVLFAVIVFQFLLKLFTSETNERLGKLGQGLSTYIYQILQYMNFNSDYQPYPFGAWPKGEPKAAKLVDQGSSASVE
jgi:hypothetical protein